MRGVQFDAVLLLSFGGPDGPDDVRPFLDNVLRGRPVTAERIEQVVSQYMPLGGRSPINDQNRALLHALGREFESHQRPRPVYWGNRNWHPYLVDTVAQMSDDGVTNAAVFVTSAYSSYSSCRQYIEDLEQAREKVGRRAPRLWKLRPYFDHPGFVEPLADGLRAAATEAGPGAPVLMSAHSLPSSMAAACDYQGQLQECADLVADRAGLPRERCSLVFQSRSGPPHQTWLEPDVVDAIDQLPSGTPAVVVTPIGFVSDHMEVVYDLDTRARKAAADRGIRLIRSATPGSDRRFVHMVCQLLDEAEDPGGTSPLSLSRQGARPFPCPVGCCPLPPR